MFRHIRLSADVKAETLLFVAWWHQLWQNWPIHVIFLDDCQWIYITIKKKNLQCYIWPAVQY